MRSSGELRGVSSTGEDVIFEGGGSIGLPNCCAAPKCCAAINTAGVRGCSITGVWRADGGREYSSTRGWRDNGGCMRTGGGRFLDLRTTCSEGLNTGWLWLSLDLRTTCSEGLNTGWLWLSLATCSEGLSTGWLSSANKSPESSRGSSTGAVAGRVAAGLFVYGCVESADESSPSTTCWNEKLHAGQLNCGTVHCMVSA